MKDTQTVINNVAAERHELSHRIIRLQAFIEKQEAERTVSLRHLNLLREQLDAMLRYKRALSHRIFDLNHPVYRAFISTVCSERNEEPKMSCPAKPEECNEEPTSCHSPFVKLRVLSTREILADYIFPEPSREQVINVNTIQRIWSNDNDTVTFLELSNVVLSVELSMEKTLKLINK